MPEKKTVSAMASSSSVMVDRPGNRVEEEDVAGLSNSQGSADAAGSTTPESLHIREKNAGNGASPDKSENADRNNGNKQVKSSNSSSTAEAIAIDAAEEAAGENHSTTFTKLPPATASSISSSSSVEGNDENDVVDPEKANERPVSKGSHTTEAAGVSPPSVGSGDGDNGEQQAQTQQTPSHDGSTAITTGEGHHGLNGSSSTTTNGTYHHQYHPQQHHPSSYRGRGGRGGGGRGYYRGGDPMMNGGGRFGPGGRGMNGGYRGGGRGGGYYQPHPHHLPLHGASLYNGPPPVGGPGGGGGGMNNPAAIQNAAAGLASSAMGFFHTQQQLLPTPVGLTVRANLMKMNAQEAREYLAAMAVQQIEYHFSAESLRRDSFLCSNLDEAGYVPLAMVCNFPTVASFAADYYEIINTLKDSLLLDYDEDNETIRLKENPTAWLASNQHGGRGAPRWVKTKTSRPSNTPAMDVQPLPPPLPQQVQRHPPPSLPYHHHHHGGYNNGFQRGDIPPPPPSAPRISPRHSNTSTTNDHHHDEKVSHEEGEGGGEEGEGAENGLAEATSEMKKLMHDEHNDVSKTEAAVVEGGKDR